MRPVEPETPREVGVVQVIRVVAIRGTGIHPDPLREVTQFWSFEGKLLAERDPAKEVVCE